LTLIQPTLFDYAALDRATEVAARSDAALVKGLIRRTAEDLIEIGTALTRQKKALPGTFLSWIATEFGWQERMAQRFMAISAKFSTVDPSSLTGLSMHALTELALPSTPLEVTIEVQRRIDEGELVTASDIKRLKADYAEVVELASDKTAQLTAAEQANLDLAANAHRLATEQSETKYAAKITDLEKRLALFEVVATESIEANPAEGNVVAFVPKEDGEPIIEGDPLVDGNGSAVDITDHNVGAHAINGAMAIIDLAQTTPEAFWAIFGTPGRKPDALKRIKGVLKTLYDIKKEGMPK
jgi:hypothetical protein